MININKLKEMAHKRDIHVVYSKLPNNLNGVYVTNDDIKLIMINKEIEGTDLEVEEIALCLGYAELQTKLNITINIFNEDNKFKSIVVSVMAEAYKNKLMKYMSCNYNKRW